MAETSKKANQRISKQELVKEIRSNLAKNYNVHDMPLNAIAMALDATLDSMLSFMKQNKEVFWSGFGVLGIQSRKATVRRNPQNGKEIKIPAKNVVKMRLFKSFVEKCLQPAPKKKK